MWRVWWGWGINSSSKLSTQALVAFTKTSILGISGCIEKGEENVTMKEVSFGKKKLFFFDGSSLCSERTPCGRKSFIL